MTASKAKRLNQCLHRILAAAMLAENYVEGLSKEDFLKDSKTQDAVCMNFIVIGENSAKLLENHSEEINANYADIPWKAMRGMRHRMAHGYEETDFDLVWDTLQAYIPELIASLGNKAI